MIIDCHDPDSLARFWSSSWILRWSTVWGEPPQYVDCGAIAGETLLGFQRVAENKTVKNRVHLDLEVDDVEAATSWIEANAGGCAHADDVEERGYRLRVMRDPEGNEFCLWFPGRISRVTPSITRRFVWPGTWLAARPPLGSARASCVRPPPTRARRGPPMPDRAPTGRCRALPDK